MGGGFAGKAERHVRLCRLGPDAPSPVHGARQVRGKAVLLRGPARLLRVRLGAVSADQASRRRPDNRSARATEVLRLWLYPGAQRVVPRSAEASRWLLPHN